MNDVIRIFGDTARHFESHRLRWEGASKGDLGRGGDMVIRRTLRMCLEYKRSQQQGLDVLNSSG